MQKVTLVGVKNVIPDLIKQLHTLGIMEITMTEYDGIESGRPLDNYTLISEQLVFVRAIKNMLTSKKSDESKQVSSVPQFDQQMDSLHSFVSKSHAFNGTDFRKMKTDFTNYIEYSARCADLRNTILTLKRDMGTLKILERFNVNYSKLRTNYLDYVVGEVTPKALNYIKDRLDKLGKPYNISYNPNFALIVYSNSFGDISGLLNEFTPLEVPANTTYVKDSMQRFLHELEARESELIGLVKKTENLSSEYSSLFVQLEKLLTIEADRSEIASKFGSTASVCIIEGWMKENDSDKLAKVLKNYPLGVYMESKKPGHHDEPPIVLDNPKRSKPYEFLTINYSLPGYSDLDPTFMYFLMVPILYGMIVGDVVYGLISVLIAKFMLGKFSKSYILSNVCRIWLYGAVFVAIFGVMFDEWMGVSHFEIIQIIQGMGLNLGIIAPLYTPWIHRLSELGLLLGVTAIIGLIQLGIAFILAAINEWNHNKSHSYAKMAWVGVEIGGTLAVCALLLNVIPPDYGMPGLVLLAISSIVIGLTEGVVGVLEVPGFSGNVLSYFRIAVIGVVGVILAEMINSLFSFFAVQGILMMLIGIPLFLVLHIVNAFIAMFESLIQGGRLNLVEFRMKMLKGGGKLFEPFAFQENIK
ncbi:MAG: hypothetical protein ABII22_01800 [Candidatus Micrarchaeota archaeon]